MSRRPAEGADGHAAADDLPERREVGRDAVERLRTAERDPEPGHHLVEDEQCAVPRALRAQRLEEAGRGRHAAHVAGHRLDDDAGDLAPGLGKAALERRGVVVRQRRRRGGDRGRNPGRIRHAERQRARARLHQQPVGMAVVAALELDDAVAAGESAREADRAHRRLGAGAHHAQALDGRHELGDPARELGLDHGRCAEREAVRGAARDRGDHVRIRMPEDHRSPGADVVDQAAAVLGLDRGAARAADEERLAADAAECAHRRVHAAGDVAARFLEAGHGRRQRRATR